MSPATSPPRTSLLGSATFSRARQRRNRMSLGSIDFLRSEMGRDSIAHSCTVVAVDYSTLVKELGTMSKQAKVSNALGTQLWER